MPYGITTNHCDGWHQPVFHDGSGAEHRGAKWPTYQEAWDACMYHAKNGVFPSEVQETKLDICPHCGQLMPEGEPK